MSEAQDQRGRAEAAEGVTEPRGGARAPRGRTRDAEKGGQRLGGEPWRPREIDQNEKGGAETARDKQRSPQRKRQRPETETKKRCREGSVSGGRRPTQSHSEAKRRQSLPC